MEKKVFEKIDEEVFKGVDSLKSSPQFGQLSQSIEGLPEEAQKFVNQGLTYLIAFLPLLILLIVFLWNFSVRSRVGQKEFVINEVKRHVQLKNKSTSIGNQLVGTRALDSEGTLKSKLSEITSQYSMASSNLSSIDFESENYGELIKSVSTVAFKELSTPKFVGVLTELLVTEKAQIENLKISKKGKTLNGEFTFTHYGRKAVNP